jgi:hypothetical protein
MTTDDLKWLIPTGVLVGTLAWKFARPSCETFLFFLIEGNGSKHEDLVRKPLAAELEQLEELRARTDELERIVDAQGDAMVSVQASLLAQGKTLSEQISQVFTPLQRTLEKMEGALERIAEDTNKNSVAIGELRGMWDGSERRHGMSDRRE